MWNRRMIVAAGLGACLCAAIRVAGPVAAQQSDAAGKAVKNSDQAQEKKQQLELDAKYAKAYLRLMDATLESYEIANRRQPNTIPTNVMHVIRNGARDARDRAQTLAKADPNDAEILLACSESELNIAESSWRRVEDANAVAAGSVSAAKVAIAKATLELAKVRVEKARHLSDEPALSTVYFEIAQLREQVQQLQILVALLGEKD
jgi:hypothetical protein